MLKFSFTLFSGKGYVQFTIRQRFKPEFKYKESAAYKILAGNVAEDVSKITSLCPLFWSPGQKRVIVDESFRLFTIYMEIPVIPYGK
jgi:hypothetical protein